MRPKIILILFSLLFPAIIFSQSNGVDRIRKIVIDAGHGGADPGAVSRDRRYAEKNITLNVALSLGRMISENFPETEVIYTRKTDVFIPLDERTQIANRNKADLFISIHVNSARAQEASGTETFVMGVDKSSSNLEVSKLENSVVVLEEDYSSKYQGFDPDNPESYIIFSLLQNSHLEQSLEFAASVQKSLNNGPIKKSRGIKQAGFLVLWRATMPSILVELGFISNYNDYKILINKESQESFARSIFNAFASYKKRYEGDTSAPIVIESPKKEIDNTGDTLPGSRVADKKEIQTALSSNETPKMVSEGARYMIQIMASSTKLPKGSKEFKGIKDVEYIKIGAYHKYFTGSFGTFEQARDSLKKIRTIFPQAFIVKEQNGEVKATNK